MYLFRYFCLTLNGCLHDWCHVVIGWFFQDIQSQGFRGSENEQTSLTSQRSYLDNASQEDLLSPNYMEGM